MKNKGLIIAIISVLSTLVVCGGIFIVILLNKPQDDANQNKTQEPGKTEVYDDNGSGISSGNGSGSGTTLTENNSMDSLPESVVRSKKVSLKGNGNDTVTILVFMNGSNLETDDGAATTDLKEMVAAGSSDKVKVVAQTMGTKKWQKDFGIANNTAQRYLLNGNGMQLVQDNLGQLDCTEANTLTDFIKWGVANYPADRYILQLWDHGGGPVYGFGYDEWNSDEDARLSLDEMYTGIKNAGVYFDFIGMDCCIMSCLELCCALYDYCDYLILSEDFESGLGWSYKGWLSALNRNPSISTVDLAKIAIDDMVNANEKDWDGDSSTLALIDQSYMKLLYAAWTSFAYANEDALLGNNYSTRVKGNRRVSAVGSRS